MKCSNCGTQISNQSEFCPNCGTQCLDGKKSSKGIIIIITIIVVILACVIGGIVLLFKLFASNSFANQNQWGSEAMCKLIPKLNSRSYNLCCDSDSYFCIYVMKMTEDDFEDYIEECEDAGFDEFSLEYEEMYSAYDEDGNYLYLCYSEDTEQIYIAVNKYEAPSELVFPDNEIADSFPESKFTLGESLYDNEDCVCIYLYVDSEDDFETYKQECMDAGYTEEMYDGEDQTFHALNENGEYITLNYCESYDNYISVTVYRSGVF